MSRWTPELKEHAIKLADQGHSASQIADLILQKFNIRKTRNAIIGALHRAGKPLHGKESVKSKNRRAMENRVRSRLTRKVAAKPISKQAAALRAIYSNPATLPPPQATDIGRVHILDLERGHCRWPVGEPTKGMFCGDEKIEGLSYCRHHSMRAYAPPQTRERPFMFGDKPMSDPGKTLQQFEELQPA